MKPSNYILDDKGKPVAEPDIVTWGRWFEANPKAKILKQTTLANDKWVSTVFLGIDHNFAETGPPVLWESMVFPKHGDYGDLDCQRYSSRSAALRGHKKLCAKHSLYLVSNEEDSA